MPGPGTKDDGRAKPDWGKAPPEPSPRKAQPAARQPGRPAPKAGPPAARARTTKAAPKAPAKRTAKGATKAAPARGKPTRGKPARSRKAAPRTRTARSGRRLQQRYGVVYDIDGPRVRLGICWFVVALGALIAGPFTTFVVYGTAAAIAAAQTARVWRKHSLAPAPLMAAAGAGLVTAGACFGAGGAGLGMLGAVVLAFVGAAGDATSRNPRIADVGWTLQCALAPGIVGMSMVLLTRLDQGSAIALLLLVSAYETGDYLIGSGSTNPFEGPGAGGAAIVVITFIVSTLPISALSFGEAWLLGGLVALLAPAGQLLASALLPAAGAPASGLRRLDSLLIAAPLWAWAVGVFAS